MCNYPKTFYPPQFHTPNLNRLNFDSQNGELKSRALTTLLTFLRLHHLCSRFLYVNFSGARGIPAAQQPINLDQQVWIRAALICVPICGLMILLVLILVARRLLRGDDEYKETGNGSTGTSFNAHVVATGDGGERMFHPAAYNKYGGFYYPSPPPPPIQEYPFIKPVSDYQDESCFSPIEIQIQRQRRQRQSGYAHTQCCCCHNPRPDPPTGNANVNNNNGGEPEENNLLLAQVPSPSSSRSTVLAEDISQASNSAISCQQDPDSDEICQCSSDSDDSRCHCRCGEDHRHCGSNMIRPPSIVFAGGGSFMPMPGVGQESSAATTTTTALKKFNNLLSRLFKKNAVDGPSFV